MAFTRSFIYLTKHLPLILLWNRTNTEKTRNVYEIVKQRKIDTGIVVHFESYGIFFANGAKRIAPGKGNICLGSYKKYHNGNVFSSPISDLVNWPESKAAIYLLNLYAVWGR